MARRRAASTHALAAPVQHGLLIDAAGARLLVGALSALSTITGIVPRVGAGEAVCRVAGLAWYLGAPAAREAVRDNLRHILGREPHEAMVREVFVHGALNYWDTLAITQLQQAQVLTLVDIRGLEHLDEALAAGHGAILAGAHLGSVALVGQIVPALGYRMTALVEQIRPPLLFDFFVRQRQRFGLHLLPANGAAIRELLEALRRNETLGLVTDRDVTGSGVLVQFFDAPTSFADGPAALALRTGARILPAIAIRHADGRFDATIEPPLNVSVTGERKHDVRELTQAMARRLEYHIADHPEQWTVFQRRWPIRRPGQ